MNARALRPLALALIVTGIALPAAAGKVNVNDSAKNAINADAKAVEALRAQLGSGQPGWKVAGVAIKSLRASAVQLVLPPYKYEYQTSREIINCAATATSSAVTLENKVTNSVTITKSDTLDVGAEVTVSAEFFGVSSSATAKTNYSVTNERSDQNTKENTISETTTVAFNDAGGRISVLFAKKMQGNKIPWTATFTPDDKDLVTFTFIAPGRPRSCVFEHVSFTGWHRCYETDSVFTKNEGMDDNISSFSVDPGTVLTLCEHPNYTGRCREYRESQRWIGDDFNDRVSALKMRMDTASREVPWATVKNLLPAGAKQFTVTGFMDISQTAIEDKRIVNYEMPKAELEELCSLIPIGGQMLPRPAGMQSAGGAAPAPRPASNARAAQAAAFKPVSASSAVRSRSLTPEEAKAKLANAKEIK